MVLSIAISKCSGQFGCLFRDRWEIQGIYRKWNVSLIQTIHIKIATSCSTKQAPESYILRISVSTIEVKTIDYKDYLLNNSGPYPIDIEPLELKPQPNGSISQEAHENLVAMNRPGKQPGEGGEDKSIVSNQRIGEFLETVRLK